MSKYMEQFVIYKYTHNCGYFFFYITLLTSIKQTFLEKQDEMAAFKKIMKFGETLPKYSQTYNCKY